jgi:Gpi18-like mannosyltransferase
MLNSAYWGQCDSIYVFFILLSLLMSIRENYFLIFIYFGIAISFKFQAILFLPFLFILYFSNRKFSILNFLLVPSSYLIMMLPSIIAGRPILSIISIYINQIKENSSLSKNYPNIYSFILGNYQFFKNFGILITFSFLLLLLIIIIFKNWKISKSNLISISLLVCYICVYFLPKMHERYGYLIDILSIIYALINLKKFYVPIIINFISLVGYMEFLSNKDIFNWQLISLINGVLLFYIYIDTLKQLSKSNENFSIKLLKTA